MNRCLLLCSLLYPVYAVVNYQASIKDVGSTEYELTIEWDHDPTTAVMVSGSYNAGSSDPNLAGPCGLGSEEISPVDNLPYWFPRLFNRDVSAEITRKTGIQYASLDWQPCGHKDIVICHAESHYDIHLYYVTPQDQSSMTCDLDPPQGKSRTALPQCRDSATSSRNHDYFKLIKNNLPDRARITDQTAPNIYANNQDHSAGQQTPLKQHDFDFCVDPSSGIMGSGMHFGDKSETLNEWRSPVTIIGSHDCKMSFFEPMVSWNWITNAKSADQSWPVFETRDLVYTQKTFTALPTSWSIRVSEGCRTCSQGSSVAACNCHLKLVLRGERCDIPGANCQVKKECIECGDTNTKDCLTGMPYRSPWQGQEECTPRATPPVPAPVPVPAPMPVPVPMPVPNPPVTARPVYTPPVTAPPTTPRPSAPVVSPGIVDPNARRYNAPEVLISLRGLVNSAVGNRILQGVSTMERAGHVDVEATLSGDVSTFSATSRQQALLVFAARLGAAITRLVNIQTRAGSTVLSFTVLNPAGGQPQPQPVGSSQSDEGGGGLEAWVIGLIVGAGVLLLVGAILLGVYCCKQDGYTVGGPGGKDIEMYSANQPYRATPTSYPGVPVTEYPTQPHSQFMYPSQPRYPAQAAYPPRPIYPSRPTY